MSSLTRSMTHKLLIPMHLGTLSSSASSSSSGSIKKNGETSRKDLILNDEIVKMHLGFEKIGLPIHGFTDTVFFVPRIFLPSRTPILSGKRYLHASLLLETKKGYNIVVEYGLYNGESMTDKDKDSYETYYWFEYSHGVRYAEMSYSTYKTYKLDYDSYSERIFPLECGRRMTLKRALEECNEIKKWTFGNYNLALQNCQDFVATFIKVIGGYRREKTAYRGLHNLSSTKIPICILNQLEENENDGWNTVGKVPIVGPIIGAFYGLFR